MDGFVGKQRVLEERVKEMVWGVVGVVVVAQQGREG